MTKIICISGKAQHGKDTTAKLMQEELVSKGHRVLIAHYGDLVKYICSTFFGWNGKKDAAGRTILQYIGTDVLRAQDNDYWVNFVKQILTFFPDEWEFVLIPDCRFPNEVEIMTKNFHAVHVRIERPDFDNGLTEEQKQHISETALDDYPEDYIVVNDGTIDDLKRKVSMLVYELTTEPF